MLKFYYVVILKYFIKRPKHDHVEGGFFYTNQTVWMKNIFFMIGAAIRHFGFLAHAEHTLKIL